MMKRIQHWVAAFLFVATFGGAAFTIATPQNTYAACSETLLTFPAWYKGLAREPEPDCGVKGPDANDPNGLTKYLGRIGLNVIEFMLQLVGYISVAYIIVGGYKYIISSGSSDKMVGARKTILNAVIGLAISLFSVAIINLVAGTLK